MAKEDEGPGGARKVISQRKLRSLMATARSTQNQVAELNGGYRSEIANAVEHNYLNKKVFTQIVRLSKMEPEDLRRWKEDFDHYFDISGLQERMDSAPALQMGEAGNAGDEDEAEDAGAEQGHRRKNVQPFPKPGSVAAE